MEYIPAIAASYSDDADEGVGLRAQKALHIQIPVGRFNKASLTLTADLLGNQMCVCVIYIHTHIYSAQYCLETLPKTEGKIYTILLQKYDHIDS